MSNLPLSRNLVASFRHGTYDVYSKMHTENLCADCQRRVVLQAAQQQPPQYPQTQTPQR